MCSTFIDNDLEINFHTTKSNICINGNTTEEDITIERFYSYKTLLENLNII